MTGAAMTRGAAMFALLVSAETLGAQPGSDIYLVQLKIEDNVVVLSETMNVTNRDGYDNQPLFTRDGTSILYTSARDNQTDIYRYDIWADLTSRVTKTTESEYSPTPTLADGKIFSVVRVEADSTQRLWHFDSDGNILGVVLEQVKPVGYHAWGDEHTVAMFVLGDPPTLQVANVRTGAVDVVMERVGRSLHKIPEQYAISFVHKVSDTEWWIKSLDLETRAITPLMRTLPASEDYAWATDDIVVMGSGSKVFQRAVGDTRWVEIADLEEHGIVGITRIAVSPTGEHMAIVGSRDEN